METIEIRPEHSTQPFGQKPNPMVKKVVEYLAEKRGFGKDSKVADQGCGALRHLKTLMGYYNDLYLVDTEYQINRIREIEGKRTSIKEYISTLKVQRGKLKIVSSQEFLRSNLGLDAVFNICTFDVVLPETRKEMLKAATRNLSKGGYFVLIIPRNDSSILCRCKEGNKYSDGYCFKNHGVYTFYTNFRAFKGLVDMASGLNLEFLEDLSIYRQVCLLFTLN